MPRNALSPKPANALVSDPLRSLLDETGKYPQYGELTGYLNERGMMPPIKYGLLPGNVQGEFATNGWGNSNLPDSGVVRIGFDSKPDTVVHELTHAADRQITNQYFEVKNKAKRGSLTPLEKQFMSLYEGLSEPAPGGTKLPRVESARTLAPDWVKTTSKYRSTNAELPAWGMGWTVSKEKDAPLHVNPTMATEFSVLLEMANRLQKSSK